MMREVFEIDTVGALLCLRACVRHMSTKNGGKGGSVVMLSSMAAIIGGAGECVWYAAAKGAVDSMVDRRVARSRQGRHAGQRHHARRHRYRHSAARPVERVGPMLPMGRPGQAGEVAEAILFLLSDARLLHQRREFAGVGRALATRPCAAA